MSNCNVFDFQRTVGRTAPCPTPIGINQKSNKTNENKHKKQIMHDKDY